MVMTTWWFSFQDEDRVWSYRTTSCPTVSYMKGHPTCDDEHFAVLKIQNIRMDMRQKRIKIKDTMQTFFQKCYIKK